MTSISNKNEIRSHTALRGMAALIVVLVHFRSFFHPSIDPDEITSFLAKGYLWVDFFFILSGFVLSYVYGIEHPERRTVRDVIHYLIARFSRIYPLHLVSLATVFLFFFMVSLISWSRSDTFCCLFDGSLRSAESLLANLLLIHAWGMFDWVTWNLPSWSLSAEFFCYLIFAALLTMDGSTRKIALTGLLCIMLFYYGFYLGISGDVDEDFRLSVIRAASAFSIGIVLFLSRQIISALSERCLTFIQITASIALLLALHFGLADVISISLMALIVLVTWEDRGSLCNWLATRYLHTIGLFSYSIYMWHYLIKFIAQQDWEDYTGLPLQSSILGSLIFVACMVSLVIPISIWSYRSLEMPARKWVSFRLTCLFETKYALTRPC
ncbi:acyltransferase [Nitrosomonas sp. Nm166]|uniref:acyltransferase family protein n=1 Tax=Nitrosomonas sp. Nm166 TaxID=1881054 RepID=UPI0008E46709|nr:acyltransferase [Nitrosomonas sp. Nm166]SFF16705.1 Peptidoglycan/LPS O-acetylase OafA/YrhL, contains acyltransferase and SGNH-hydrolase domains [Nitrosomonas sp. Nm166]